MEKALKLLKILRDDYIHGELDKDINEAIAELEEAMKLKTCEGCGYGKTTINSVICGKNGTFKEADDYCKYYNPKEQ